MLDKVAAAPFKKRNTDTVTKTKFIYTISGDYNWFTPEEAEKIVEICAEHGLVVWQDDDQDTLSCSFDVSGVEIPSSFSPDFSEIDANIDTEWSDTENGDEDGNGSESIIDRVLSKLTAEGFERREAVAEINKEHQKLGNVDIEAAGVVVAKREGVEVDELAEDALSKMK